MRGVAFHRGEHFDQIALVTLADVFQLELGGGMRLVEFGEDGIKYDGHTREPSGDLPGVAVNARAVVSVLLGMGRLLGIADRHDGEGRDGPGDNEDAAHRLLPVLLGT